VHPWGGYIPWQDEHSFLRDLNQDVARTHWQVWLATEYESDRPLPGSGLAGTGNAFSGLEAAIDRHRTYLEEHEQQATGRIRSYQQRAQFLLHNLDLIRQHGIAVVHWGNNPGTTLFRPGPSFFSLDRHFIAVRDLRQHTPGGATPTANTTIRRWVGRWSGDGTRFIVTGVASMADMRDTSGTVTPLGRSIEVDFSNGNNVQEALQAIDAALAAAPVAHGRPAGVSLPESALGTLTAHLPDLHGARPLAAAVA
jgi:hypothetical protein